MPKAAALLALLAGPLAGAAVAQDQDQPVPPVPNPWVLKFEPAAWYAATNGDVLLPGTTSSGNGQSIPVADLNLDSPRLGPMGDLQLRRGNWRIGINGLGFSTGDQDITPTAAGQLGAAAFSAGDTVRTSIDFATFSLEGGYDFHRFESGKLDSGTVKVRSSLAALAGVRVLDTEIQTQVFAPGSSVASGSSSADAFQAHPYAGFRWEMDLYEQFTLDLTGSVGGLTLGDSQSWSSDIMVGFQWNPTPHFGAQLGYRQLLFGTEKNTAPSEFAWNGGLAGVYAGAVVRF
jgi:opacity protein-like surface antigen